MKIKIIRVVKCDDSGTIITENYESLDEVAARYEPAGIDDCSTHMDIRGLPMFRNLIGPMREGDSVIRYESPRAFEQLTRQWVKASPLLSRKILGR